MPTRTALTLALLCVAVASGCGSNDPFGASTTGATTGAATTTTATSAAPAEPRGRLSAGEYKTFVAVAKVGDKLGKGKSPKKVMRATRVSCHLVARAPQTQLMVVQRRFCPRGTRFLAASFAFRTEAKPCLRDLNAGDVSCIGELYSRLARSTHSILASGRELNAALKARGLHGRCADGIGASSAKELRDAAAIGRAARLAGQAVYARKVDRYLAANAQLNAAFKRLGEGGSQKELPKIRACKHD